MLSWSSETAPAACGCGAPKKLTLDRSPKDNNFVKLRDLGQDQAKRGFCLQEALAGRSCGCRSGDAKEDPLASLAIRLEQCQRLVQIFLVLARVEKWMGTRDQDYQLKAGPGSPGRSK